MAYAICDHPVERGDLLQEKDHDSGCIFIAKKVIIRKSILTTGSCCDILNYIECNF